MVKNTSCVIRKAGCFSAVLIGALDIFGHWGAEDGSHASVDLFGAHGYCNRASALAHARVWHPYLDEFGFGENYFSKHGE